MEFIKPVWWEDWSDIQKNIFMQTCMESENNYDIMLNEGATPEQAREILPNSLKTEIICTANIREWRHIFRLRCSKQAHPQIRTLMQGCLDDFRKRIPIIFELTNERTAE